MKQTEIKNKFIELEKRLGILEGLSGVKKEEDLSLGNSLGTRSEIGEENKQRDMPVDADNQHRQGIKKRGRPKKVEQND